MVRTGPVLLRAEAVEVAVEEATSINGGTTSSAPSPSYGVSHAAGLSLLSKMFKARNCATSQLLQIFGDYLVVEAAGMGASSDSCCCGRDGPRALRVGVWAQGHRVDFLLRKVAQCDAEGWHLDIRAWREGGAYGRLVGPLLRPSAPLPFSELAEAMRPKHYALRSDNCETSVAAALACVAEVGAVAVGGLGAGSALSMDSVSAFSFSATGPSRKLSKRQRRSAMEERFHRRHFTTQPSVPGDS